MPSNLVGEVVQCLPVPGYRNDDGALIHQSDGDGAADIFASTNDERDAAANP
jgi:hypothetical protein